MKSTMVLPSQLYTRLDKTQTLGSFVPGVHRFSDVHVFFPKFFPSKKKPVISPHSYSTEAEEVLCVIRQQTCFPLKWLNTGE